jgi:hypothetical protein
MRTFKKVLLIVGISSSLLALAASGETAGTSGSSESSSASSDSGDTQVTHAPEDDVDIASCTTDSLGSPEAKIKITNHSSKPSNYIVEVAFESPDGSTQIDTSMVSVNNLQPGQSATEDAVTFGDAPSDFVCKITDVTRYAS